jgi:hypothetical protein
MSRDTEGWSGFEDRARPSVRELGWERAADKGADESGDQASAATPHCRAVCALLTNLTMHPHDVSAHGQIREEKEIGETGGGCGGLGWWRSDFRSGSGWGYG